MCAIFFCVRVYTSWYTSCIQRWIEIEIAAFRLIFPTFPEENMVKFGVSKEERNEGIRCAGVWILNLLFKEGKCKKAEQYDKMYDYFHGKAGTRMISHKHDLVAGQGIFDGLWEVDEDLGGVYVLKSKYLCTNKVIVISPSKF